MPSNPRAKVQATASDTFAEDRAQTLGRLFVDQSEMSEASPETHEIRRSPRARTLDADGSRLIATHIFDGGRSRSVRQGVQPLLDEARGRLNADIGIAFHRSNSGALGVLVASGDRASLLPLVNEQMRVTDSVGRSVTAVEPKLVNDVVLTSQARPFRLECSSALLLPWSDGTRVGLIIIGTSAGAWSNATLMAARRYGQQIGAIHRDASYRGTVRLAEDLAAACKAIDHAELEARNPADFLTSLTSISRSVMGTSTAYIAMPENGAADTFPLTNLVGIRTSAFRRLCMRRGQGLGGFSRREGKTVHTTHYCGDQRLQQAPVKETISEGILSAICTPLIVDGQIAGTLYFGERQPRAFSDTDTDLLDHLAEHIELSLNRQNIEEHRRSVMRHRERDRLASAMHDSVVRSLVEIGYQAEMGCMRGPEESIRQLLEAIGTTAGTALEQVRSELFAPGGRAASGAERRAGELIEILRLVARRPEVRRTIKLESIDRDTTIPERAFDALVSVGEEALVNAERHSGCSNQEVRLKAPGTEFRLTIKDDGVGIADAATENALGQTSGHLGLRSMRAVAQAQGGSTRIASRPRQSGTEVIVRIPLRPGSSA